MNLDHVKTNKTQPPATAMEDIEFDFKPITSGLGFHHAKRTEVRPQTTERTVAVAPIPGGPKKEMNVYQSDLSIFYGQQNISEPVQEIVSPVKEEKIFKLASRGQRFWAYLLDLSFLVSILGIVLTIMARTISMDLLEVWSLYPHEITPLVVTLFCGFYLIYFSIFEKSTFSTLGKNIFGLRVVNEENQQQTLTVLLIRSSFGLLNFISLGLFSYFDLQNKVTGSKIVKVK